MTSIHSTSRYITTAIPFVNARPHIGFALEIVLTDSIARYYRQHGEDVRFLTGSDENSLKNVQAAEREGIAVAESYTSGKAGGLKYVNRSKRIMGLRFRTA